MEEAKQNISELTSELSATKSQLAQARVQQEALVSSLRAERRSAGLRSSKHVSDNTNEKEIIEFKLEIIKLIQH